MSSSRARAARKLGDATAKAPGRSLTSGGLEAFSQERRGAPTPRSIRYCSAPSIQERCFGLRPQGLRAAPRVRAVRPNDRPAPSPPEAAVSQQGPLVLEMGQSPSRSRSPLVPFFTRMERGRALLWVAGDRGVRRESQVSVGVVHASRAEQGATRFRSSGHAVADARGVARGQAARSQAPRAHSSARPRGPPPPSLDTVSRSRRDAFFGIRPVCFRSQQ